MTNIQLSEQWKPIPGYVGLYEVSDLGNVRATQGKQPKIYNCQGYRKVYLKNGFLIKYWGVHTLVAKAFIPNPRQKLQTNHKDFNRANNHITNLEWCTRSENALHAVNPLTRGDKNPYTPLYRRYSTPTTNRRRIPDRRLNGITIRVSDSQRIRVVKRLKKYGVIGWPKEIATRLKEEHPAITTSRVYRFFRGSYNPLGPEILRCALEVIEDAPEVPRINDVT